FSNEVPIGPVASAGYVAPPTVPVPVRGSVMTGIFPVGRGIGSELKYPAESRYEKRSLGACASVTLPPKIWPAPLPTVDPASRLNPPAVRIAVVPTASRGDLVMM